MEYLYAAIELLLSPAALLALLIYTLLTFISEWSGAYLAQHCKESSAPILALEHLYIPWFNLLSLTLFLSSLQPQIFGVTELQSSQFSLKRVTDITLFISLILPLIPVIGRAEFILPVQGIIIVTIIFRGLNEMPTNLDIDYWPDWSTMGLMVIVSVIGLFISRLSSAHLGEWLDEKFERRGFERALQHSLQLILQAPIIFIYAFGLGAQITP
ncbi:MAG: hypothetical protein OQK25_00665 [Gammaproteobacteria bacterium]|nr:hypothetical protein [Gammaproteobacteria bacterium]